MHAIQRMRAVHAAYGTEQQPARITSRDVLDFATLQGARTNGLGHVTGSLTPGTVVSTYSREAWTSSRVTAA